MNAFVCATFADLARSNIRYIYDLYDQLSHSLQLHCKSSKVKLTLNARVNLHQLFCLEDVSLLCSL